MDEIKKTLCYGCGKEIKKGDGAYLSQDGQIDNLGRFVPEDIFRLYHTGGCIHGEPMIFDLEKV